MMLRTTISRIKKVCSVAFLPRLLRGDQRCAACKFEILSYAVVKKVQKSTKSTDDDEYEHKQERHKDANKHCYAQEKQTDNLKRDGEIQAEDAFKENIAQIVSPKAPLIDAHSEKCQRIIDQAFGKPDIEPIVGEQYFSHSVVQIEETKRELDKKIAKLKFSDENNIDKPTTDERIQFGKKDLPSVEPDDLIMNESMLKATGTEDAKKIGKTGGTMEDLTVMRQALNVHMMTAKENVTQKLENVHEMNAIKTDESISHNIENVTESTTTLAAKDEYNINLTHNLKADNPLQLKATVGKENLIINNDENFADTLNVKLCADSRNTLEHTQSNTIKDKEQAEDNLALHEGARTGSVYTAIANKYTHDSIMKDDDDTSPFITLKENIVNFQQNQIENNLNVQNFEEVQIVHATTAQEDEEQLTQKIEHIDETPLVEAPKLNIEGFNVTPKVLGEGHTYISEKNVDNQQHPKVNIPTSFDEVAKRCLDTPPSQIDEILLREMEKLGIPITSNNRVAGGRSPVIEDDLVQMDVLKKPRRPVEKKDLDLESHELEKVAVNLYSTEKLDHTRMISNEKLLPESEAREENLNIEPIISKAPDKPRIHPNQVLIDPYDKKTLAYDTEEYDPNETYDPAKKYSYFYVPVSKMAQGTNEVQYNSTLPLKNLNELGEILNKEPLSNDSEETMMKETSIVSSICEPQISIPDDVLDMQQVNLKQLEKQPQITYAKGIDDTSVSDDTVDNEQLTDDKQRVYIKGIDQISAVEQPTMTVSINLGDEKQLTDHNPSSLGMSKTRASGGIQENEEFIDHAPIEKQPQLIYFEATDHGTTLQTRPKMGVAYTTRLHHKNQLVNDTPPEEQSQINYANTTEKESTSETPKTSASLDGMLDKEQFIDHKSTKMQPQITHSAKAIEQTFTMEPPKMSTLCNQYIEQLKAHKPDTNNQANLYSKADPTTTKKPEMSTSNYLWGQEQLDPRHVLTCNETCPISPRYSENSQGSSHPTNTEDIFDCTFKTSESKEINPTTTFNQPHMCVSDATWNSGKLGSKNTSGNIRDERINATLAFNKTNMSVSDDIWDTDQLDSELTAKQAHMIYEKVLDSSSFDPPKMNSPHTISENPILKEQIVPKPIVRSYVSRPITSKVPFNLGRHVGAKGKLDCYFSKIQSNSESSKREESKEKQVSYSGETIPVSNLMQADTVLHPLAEEQAHDTDQTNIPVTFHPLPNLSEDVSLSELLRRVRERSRILECTSGLKALGVQIEPTVGKCNRKSPRCPPTAPRSPPSNPVPPPPMGLPSLKPRPRACPPKRAPKAKCTSCDMDVSPSLQLGPKLSAQAFPCPEMVYDMPEGDEITITQTRSKADLTDEVIDRLQTLGKILGAVLRQGKADILEAGALVRSQRVPKVLLARNYEPWAPIPSWPSERKQEKNKPNCSPGCKIFPPPRLIHDPPSDGGGKPCTGFPKKTFSLLDCFAVSLGDHKVYDLGEF